MILTPVPRTAPQSLPLTVVTSAKAEKRQAENPTESSLVVTLKPEISSLDARAAFEKIAHTAGLQLSRCTDSPESSRVLGRRKDPNVNVRFLAGFHPTKGNIAVLECLNDNGPMKMIGAAAAAGALGLAAATKSRRSDVLGNGIAAGAAVVGSMPPSGGRGECKDIVKAVPSRAEFKSHLFDDVETWFWQLGWSTAPRDAMPLDLTATALAPGYTVTGALSFQSKEMFYLDVPPLPPGRRDPVLRVTVSSTLAIGLRAAFNRKPGWLSYDIKETQLHNAPGRNCVLTITQATRPPLQPGRLYFGVWGNSFGSSSQYSLRVNLEAGGGGGPQASAAAAAAAAAAAPWVRVSATTVVAPGTSRPVAGLPRRAIAAVTQITSRPTVPASA
mmetsp:Transcript_16359/g.38447  ORF Transcript_16359/g.38447 Transcript_16359/m.38447 type:complete len:387 (-) Transcript_16359:812-1972(-)